MYTPNGAYSVTESAPISLPLPFGTIRTEALLNPSMDSNIISPLPIIDQNVPIILYASEAYVLPPHHPTTREAIMSTKKIASVNNGVYELNVRPKSKPTPYARKALGFLNLKPKRMKIARAVDNVMIPSPRTTKPKALPIVISTPPSKNPKTKSTLDKKRRAMAYDYQLLFNHASLSEIMKSLNNPALQYDPAHVPPTTHAPLTCSPCHDAKLRTAPHHRKAHQYMPGQAISSDVAGPFNYHGQSLDEA